MSYSFDKKTVVITGGASGIGYAIANNFLLMGVAKVIIIDINEKLVSSTIETLRSSHKEHQVDFYKADVVTDLSDCYKKILDKNSIVDILVNCAGIGDETLVDKIVNTNTTALIQWSLKFHEQMRCDKSGKGGTIINISSDMGYRVLPYTPVYQATKFAVLGFSKSLGHVSNYRRFGVRVITICPGFTETDLANTSRTYFTELKEDFADYIRTGTFQKADLVGKYVVELFKTAESGTVWEISNSNMVLIP